MRGITAFVVTVFLLVGVGVVVDALVTARAEEEASLQLSGLLGGDADVDLRGWPVSLRLLAGNVPEVGVVATDVGLSGDVGLDRLEVTVADVRVTFADVRAPQAARVSGGAGTFTALLDEAAVGALVGFPGAVTLGDGIGQVQAQGVSADVTAAVEGGSIVLRPVGAVPPGVEPVPISLPPLPGQAVVDSARIVPGALRLEGRVLRLVP